MARTSGDQWRSIVDLYRESGEPWPATARDMATWAFRMGHVERHREAVIDQFAEMLSRAMREEYYTDPQGRKVRTKHAAKIGQQTLWDDIRDASHLHMEISFQQRRQQIVGDCLQLKTDVDSYNENRCPARKIQMIFDFSEDLAELENLEGAA